MNKKRLDSLIIVPVHNRCATTLYCLRQLKETGVFGWALVLVVDDGSTDGTSDDIAGSFSCRNVKVLRGDGSLWWAGGINKGLEYAIENRFDYVIWLNDDCLPVGHALRALRDFSEQTGVIAIGQASTPSRGWYGGYRKAWFGLDLLNSSFSQSDVACDTFAGNAVCLPRIVVETTGYLDAERLPMTYADVDFGLRARDAGFCSYIVHDACFENEDNMGFGYQSWLLGDYKTWDMWKSFFSVKSPVAMGPRFCFFVRHWGLWGYVLAGHVYVRFWLMALLRFAVPLSLLRRMFGGRARMWRKYRYYGERTKGCK